jgi:hypothetical protein
VLRYLAISLVVVLATCLPGPGDPDAAVLSIQTLNGRVETARLEVARSEADRERGLAGRSRIPTDGGMVFLLEEPSDHGFWMRGVTVPLSIAFWDDGGRIVAIMDMEPCRAEPCPLYFPGRPYVGAAEMQQGWFDRHGVEVGDVVRLRDA